MPKRILTVEDDPDILSIVEFILGDEGFEVFTSIDGKDILKQLERIHPHLVLMDVRLPGADGRELCKEIKNSNDSIPVILMSAHLDYKTGILEECANDFISKPFDINELVKRINNQLIA